MTVCDLPHGWDNNHLIRLAWRLARGHPATVLPMAERADIAYLAMVIALLEAETPPTTRELSDAGIQAIAHEVHAYFHDHGYSVRDRRTMPAFAAFWVSPPKPHDAWADAILEKIAVQQIMPALTLDQRTAIKAVAEYGNYASAADALGWSYYRLNFHLGKGRERARRLWHYPDTPPGHWAQSRPALRGDDYDTGQHRAQRRWHRRNRGRYTGEAA